MQYSEQIVLVWSYNSTIKLDRGHARMKYTRDTSFNQLNLKEAIWPLTKKRKQKPRE